jgi:GNAT superfamily N-acetyltransferase
MTDEDKGVRSRLRDKRSILSVIDILNTRADRAEACASLQPLCYPTLAEEEQFSAAHFRKHVQLFPEGQFMAVDRETGAVVGTTAGFLTHFDRIDPEHFKHHTFFEAIAEGWLSHHNPRGNYYYGVDMCVHPDYRGRGIARMLHGARKALSKRLGLRGQVIGGMIPGYASYKHVMTAHEYAHYVRAGLIYDSTLSTQLRNGFEFRGMLQHYLKDPPTEGWSTLLEWRNPEHVSYTAHVPVMPIQKSTGVDAGTQPA